MAQKIIIMSLMNKPRADASFLSFRERLNIFLINNPENEE